MGSEATWRDTSWPPGCGMWTRNTKRTRVFFRPMSVSPFLSSMSAFLSFRIPTQSILGDGRQSSLRGFVNTLLVRWASPISSICYSSASVGARCRQNFAQAFYCFCFSRSVQGSFGGSSNRFFSQRVNQSFCVWYIVTHRKWCVQCVSKCQRGRGDEW